MMIGRCFKIFFLMMLLVAAVGRGAPALAADMPTAAGSPIAGISFDDRPLILPVQRNIQMAMLTASSELGRSCGRMEAYGWRTASDEQGRVNLLFNNVVDRLRAQGFAVESKTVNSVSRDVTMFIADRTDKHLIFLWSAGEIGLVMVLCETSAPVSALSSVQSNAETNQPASLPSHLPMADTVRTSGRLAGEKMTVPLSATGKPLHKDFSPMGQWIGNYTCAQGTTGATLSIEKVKGEQFEGEFKFYPTPRNPYVPVGSYRVFGEYDADSQRILINPGKWVNRPKDFFNTIMIGSFDPAAGTFSGYFQGITGCTSFEAHLAKAESATKKAVKEKKASKKKETKPAPAKKTEKTVSKTDKAGVTAPKKKEAVAAKPAAPETAPLVPVAAPQKLDPVKAPAATQAEAAKTAKDAMAIVKAPAPVTTGRTSAIEPPAGIVLGTDGEQK